MENERNKVGEMKREPIKVDRLTVREIFYSRCQFYSFSLSLSLSHLHANELRDFRFAFYLERKQSNEHEKTEKKRKKCLDRVEIE